MGEAKQKGSFEERKKQASKNITRGVVTPPGQVTITGNRYSLTKPLSGEDLLYYAMYWDKIIIPSGLVQFNSPLHDELIRNGVLSQPSTFEIPPHPSTIDANGGLSMERHELYAFGEIAKSKLNAKFENWVISHIGGDPIYSPLHCEEENVLRLRVSQILPFPALTGEYSIDDLLNFKLRRSSELAALHESMDNLIKKIHDEPIQAIRESELKRFENAVQELDKTLIERFKVIQKSDWEVSFTPDISTIMEESPKLIGGFALDNFTGTSFPVFSSIAAITSMLSINKKIGFTFNQYAKDDLKLSYISGAKSEKIIP